MVAREGGVAQSRWTRRDWTIVIVSALVFGPLYLAWDEVYNALLHVKVPGVNLATSSLINGFWFLGGFVPLALTRKPGTCLVGETLAALVEVLLAEVFGGYPIAYMGETYTSFLYNFPGKGAVTYHVFNVVFFVGILEGLGPEAVFGFLKYRKFTLPAWLAAGTAGALLEWMTGIWVTHYYFVDAYEQGRPLLLWGTLLTSVIAIGGIAGSLSWWLGRRFGPADAVLPGEMERPT